MIPYSTQYIEQDDIEAVNFALESSHLTQGALTQEFEATLASKIGVQYAISFNSATSALFALYGAFMYKYFPHLAHFYNTLDSKISKQDKEEIYFITTPISFVATTNMMLQWGITPLFCDVKDDGNIDEKALEHILSTHPKRAHIKAIVSVDYGGKSVEIISTLTCTKTQSFTFFR